MIHSVRSNAPSIRIASKEDSPNDDIPQSEPEARDAPTFPRATLAEAPLWTKAPIER